MRNFWIDSTVLLSKLFHPKTPVISVNIQNLLYCYGYVLTNNIDITSQIAYFVLIHNQLYLHVYNYHILNDIFLM